MGKVYESDIDPDEFIRSFREESSSLSSLKKPEVPKEQTAGHTPSPQQQSAKEESEPDSDRENEYMEKFVRNMRYMAPEDKFTTTEIDPDFIWKIRKILFCRKKGRVCSVKAYINNVLAAHFDEYAEIINPKL